jgi:hypothetical protein
MLPPFLHNLRARKGSVEIRGLSPLNENVFLKWMMWILFIDQKAFGNLRFLNLQRRGDLWILKGLRNWCISCYLRGTRGK